jgi:hypothetical protein
MVIWDIIESSNGYNQLVQVKCINGNIHTKCYPLSVHALFCLRLIIYLKCRKIDVSLFLKRFSYTLG